MHPPLRSAADVEAIARGLADGTLDAIATDHAPHPPEEKERPFDHAPPGMLGLEYALARREKDGVWGGATERDRRRIIRQRRRAARLAQAS